jgi:hypothetical protein
MPAWLDSILPTLLNAVLLGLIFLFFPQKKSKAQTNKTYKELIKEFRWFFLISSLGIYLLIALLTVGLGYLFFEIDTIGNTVDNDAIIIVKPGVLSWMGASLFLSIALSFRLSTRLIKKYLKDRFNDFMALNNMIQKADVYRFMEILSPVLIAVSLISVIVISHSSTVLYKDKIVVSYYFKFSPVKYRYSDIKKIQEFTDDKDEQYFHITFNDGEVWNSRQNGYDDYKKDSKILDVLEEKVPDEVWE